MSKGGDNVLHVITSLHVGGAEIQLLRLAGALRLLDVSSEVISLTRAGAVGGQLDRLGVPVRDVGMSQGSLSPGAAWRLTAMARHAAPSLVQGWMYHGNLAASWLALAAPGRPPVVWNVRHSLHDLTREKPLSRAVIRLGATLSGRPAAIVYNSSVSERQHRDLGYAPARAVVIPNGFDCERFRPRRGARERLRGLIGAGSKAAVVGMVARNHPMKDWANLLAAVALLRAARPELRLAMIGRGFGPDDPDAAGMVARAGLAGAVALLGERDDLHELMPGLDVLALPSAWGEGFPNVLGEAMASGVPCVATDIGDSAWIVGEFGLVVPARDSSALAAALGRLLDLGTGGRERLGGGARDHVAAHFSLAEVARRYAELYATVKAPGPKRSR